MKKVLYLVLAAMIVCGLGTAQAYEPICIVSECDPDFLMQEVCCPIEVPVNPRCKGPNCKTKIDWECYWEPCDDPYFLGALPIFAPVPTNTNLNPVNVEQSLLN